MAKNKKNYINVEVASVTRVPKSKIAFWTLRNGYIALFVGILSKRLPNNDSNNITIKKMKIQEICPESFIILIKFYSNNIYEKLDL